MTIFLKNPKIWFNDHNGKDEISDHGMYKLNDNSCWVNMRRKITVQIYGMS